ncbi:MAG: radical SAM protein [Treponema sp.]|nr:radical SAM protein [Treponema sp.]
MKDILLATINAKWIHPSLALRLLKANLGRLQETCDIVEFTLRQPLSEKIEALLAAAPRILGISVSIWNHTATVELLRELEKAWAPQSLLCKHRQGAARPVVILGGPEVSHLSEEAEIFRFADYVIRGEGELAFRTLCEDNLAPEQYQRHPPKFINAEPVKLEAIKSGYRLYTDEDLAKKLVYVEASRGCPFNCEFCLSAAKDRRLDPVREFPLDVFLLEMDALVRRGAKTFKFLDRTFNFNIKRTLRICEFFLKKINEREEPLTVHFETVPSLFPPQLLEMLSHFPPATLRLETGIQTLNGEVAARIGLPGGKSRYLNPEKELVTLRLLHEKTNAIIHTDLIAGLPGEDLTSFGKGFDCLWLAFTGSDTPPAERPCAGGGRFEIQLGILKLLQDTPISRHNETFAMRYNPLPPYEVMETSTISAGDLRRIKNFARFWELIINRGLIKYRENKPVFENFMALSDSLFTRFKRNWGIDKNELLEAVNDSRFVSL